MRQVTSELAPATTGGDQSSYRLFRINNQPILIKGAGWAPDLFLRENATRVRSEMQYVKDMNLNTIRMEGKMPIEPFFEIADEMGLLLMPGTMFSSSKEHIHIFHARLVLL